MTRARPGNDAPRPGLYASIKEGLNVKKLSLVLMVGFVAAIVLAVLCPAPAVAANPTGTPFYDAVFITNLQARVAVLEAFADTWTGTNVAPAITNRLAILEAATGTWNTAKGWATFASNALAAGISGVITNDLSHTNVMQTRYGVITNNAATGP